MFLEELPKKVILLQAGSQISNHTLAAWSKSLSKKDMMLSVAKPKDKPTPDEAVYIIDLSHRDDEAVILESVAKFSDDSHRLVVLANGNTKLVMDVAKKLQLENKFPVAKNCHIANFPKHKEDFVQWLEKVLLNKPRPTPTYARSAIL